MSEVQILVNNAGLALGVASTDENDLGDVQTMLNTNVLGVMALTRMFAPGMKARGAGHIVTIASRHDLAGTPLRVTAISPGMVETDFSKTRFGGDEAKAAKVYEGILPLVAEDIADQVIYVTTRPRHVQIADIISYATNQGHAKYVVERKGESMGAKRLRSS